MKFVISAALIITLLSSGTLDAETLREATLRQAAINNGLIKAEETHIAVTPEIAAIGKLLFETKLLSPDSSIACATCHVDRFGSSDGLPQAIGVGGKGIGLIRLHSNGRIIPRNTLPFWGRGGKGFDVFFWDGKVDASGEALHSQFGSRPPSADPLVVAVHLPPAELREMVADDSATATLQTESVESGQILYEWAAQRIADESAIGSPLAAALKKRADEIQFADIAEALAAFIRYNFELRNTEFHRFVFDGSSLPDAAIDGGLIFYGKGRCSACHNGPYFSDFDFHAIPFPPLGFGKNGFGVDYGRYNVTLRPADLNLFRTPPLYNVTETAPYGHAGSVSALSDAIAVHSDPLALVDTGAFTPTQKSDFYQSLKAWSHEPVSDVVLLPEDITKLMAFLQTLNYEARWNVQSE